MNMEELFSNVQDREDTGSIAIDGDSLLFFTVYKYRDNYDTEVAYFDFAGRVKSIERELYTKVNTVEDIALCFTAKRNFRYELYPDYKANRATTNEDMILLKQRVTELKKLVYERVKTMCRASNIVESDDLCISLAREKGYYVSAMDKDIVSQCPTECFNFHTKHWNWNKALTDKEIERNILIQTLVGDASDNFNFVKGYGKVKASKFIDELLSGKHSFSAYVDLFGTPDNMLLANRLCNMYQYKNGKLVLVEVQDVFNMVSPF